MVRNNVKETELMMEEDFNFDDLMADVFGNKVTAPTEDKTVLSNRETKGDNVDSSLSTDEVSAQQGEIKAAKQEGKASTTEATASEAGATASRAKGGASDIETKALKIT